MFHNVAWNIILLIAGLAVLLPAQTAGETQLLRRISELEQRLAAVEARLGPAPAAAPAVTQAVPPASVPEHSAIGESTSLPGVASGTINVLLDGYYEYNFNRSVDRVNLLRPYDPSSNSFTLNQAVVVIERAADVANGRRFGARLDLMFGQSTESLSGNPANELRTAPYRNIFQAYGTYVVPLGRGLNVDFGRFASPFGVEGSFAKDQLNYTRSMLFTALPFYHMGFRTHVPAQSTAIWAAWGQKDGEDALAAVD